MCAIAHVDGKGRPKPEPFPRHNKPIIYYVSSAAVFVQRCSMEKCAQMKHGCATGWFIPQKRSECNAFVIQATTDDLKQAIFDEKDRKGKYSPVRQRLTLPPAPGAKAGAALAPGQALESYGLENGAVVQYKDLGMQVCYHCSLTAVSMH